MRILLFLLTGLLAVSATDNGSRAADATQELVRFLPSDANTVSVVRVRQILETPRAQAEGWSDLTEEGFLAGASRIPPWCVRRFLKRSGRAPFYACHPA